MNKIICSLFLLFAVLPYSQLSAQIMPGEGAVLTYRIIGFSFPQGGAGSKYKIEIADGDYASADSFSRHVIKSFGASKARIIGEVPAFGRSYTWCVVTTAADNKITKSGLHHFSTGFTAQVDSDITRFRILDQASKYGNDYVFLDVTRTLYDMHGRAVWYLPYMKDTNSLKTKDVLRRSRWGTAAILDNGTRDMKITPRGTVTFMDTNRLYEVNYNGDIVWQKKATDLQDSLASVIDNYYHHELTRLANGHYMSLGIEVVPLELPERTKNIREGKNPALKRDSLTNKLYQQVLTGRLVEMDQKGNKVWEWNSSDYLKGSDLMDRRRENGMFKLNNTHENAFYFDEKAKVIYISFRNLNRIVKIQYPSGKVLRTYGTLYTPGDQELNNDLFCGEHSVRRSMEGYIYLYNNNTCNFPCQFPTIIMMKEPQSATEPLQKVWEYECRFDSLSEQELKMTHYVVGGNVFEMPDRSIFCCMGGSCPHTFIVGRDKKIVWSALLEAWNKNDKKWAPLHSYRASIISRDDLEHLIWNEPLKN